MWVGASLGPSWREAPKWGRMGGKAWRHLTGTWLTIASSERERGRSWIKEGITGL